VLLSQFQICVSLDGVVIKDCAITKIFEIKCPIKCNNKPIFNVELGKFEIGYVEKVKDEMCLQKSHQYYTQIQVQIYVSGATVCDFFCVLSMWKHCSRSS
jgi:hypothetical protein